MKHSAMIAAAAVVLASVGSASAQEGNVITAVPNAALNTVGSVLPFGRSDGLQTGRSAVVDRSDTSRVYGIGPDGQGILAPGINGIF